MIPKSLEAEALEELAQFAWDIAAQTCLPEHGCETYHRLWPMIRYLMKDAALPAGGHFFGPQLAALNDGTPRRILLSGGADSGLLALTYAATKDFAVAPSYFLVDRCDTSVALNKRFAQNVGITLETQTATIQDCRFTGMDAVLSHSFLIFFPAAIRHTVVETWARALKPGGVALTAFSMPVGDAKSPVPLTDDEVAVLVERLDAAAAARGLDAEMRAELRTEAAAFWRLRPTFESMTEVEMRGLFEDAGFVIDDVVRKARGAVEGPRDRPKAQSNRKRIFFAAKKPV